LEVKSASGFVPDTRTGTKEQRVCLVRPTLDFHRFSFLFRLLFSFLLCFLVLELPIPGNRTKMNIVHYPDDGHATVSSMEQFKIENTMSRSFRSYRMPGSEYKYSSNMRSNLFRGSDIGGGFL
jgi:hypothetical protein